MTEVQANSRSEDTWVFKAHLPPMGACDNMISVVQLLANLQEKESFVDVVYDGIQAAGGRWWLF